MASQLKITLVKSTIGRVEKQQATVKALGLNKIGKTVDFIVKSDNKKGKGK